MPVPDFVAAPRITPIDAGACVSLWADAMAAASCKPGPHRPSAPTTCAVMPYTSGTTGHPKGCMHTHRTTMYNTVSGGIWGHGQPGHGEAWRCCRSST